jgi:hypothetical protein
MNYLNKFIKYKTKYLKLKNNQIGHGNTGAKNKLIQAINKFNDNEKKEFIIKLQLSDNNNKKLDLTNIDKIFEFILDIFNQHLEKGIVRNKYADFLVSLYLSNVTFDKITIKELINKHYILSKRQEKTEINLKGNYNEYSNKINVEYKMIYLH